VAGDGEDFHEIDGARFRRAGLQVGTTIRTVSGCRAVTVPRCAFAARRIGVRLRKACGRTRVLIFAFPAIDRVRTGGQICQRQRDIPKP
jgi:hypothetical protein